MAQNESANPFPFINTFDFILMKKMIKHSKMNQDSARLLYDMCSQALFQENFNDLCSLSYIGKLVVLIFEKYEVELGQLWMKFV